MKVRPIILTILLAAAFGWFVFEQNRGRTHEAEEWFLDFLVANARDTLARSAPAVSPDVVLVEFREEDKAEYETWPPSPLDYFMMLKRLAEHEPPVLVVVAPLRWEQPNTQVIAQLRDSLVKFPWVLLGFHLAEDNAEATPEQKEFAADAMPVLPAAKGGQPGLPKFTRVAMLTEKSLRYGSQAGFTSISGAKSADDVMPFVADDGTRLVPSLAAQAVTLFRRVPFAEQRLHFGRGARLSLSDTFIIPLRDDGSLQLSDRPRVPKVNALELMTSDLGDETSKAVQATLGKGKVVVLGNGADSLSHARAIATALAMPQIKRASEFVVRGFTAAACLFCFWQLRFRRLKALVSGFAALIVGLGICLLAFQSSFTWWPPMGALLLVAVSTVFCFLWPAKKSSAAAPAVTVPEPQA